MKIFVFGSNREGRHGKGAALEARLKWGAIYGQAAGRQGSSYGIITKELRYGLPAVTLFEVAGEIERFLAHARAHPEDEFILTKVGCGLAGFNELDIKHLFKDAPANVIQPAWKEDPT